VNYLKGDLMEKITIKLTKYFMVIITLIVAITLASSSVFLSRFYLKQQYDALQVTAEDIYDSLNNNLQITNNNI